MDKGNFVGMVLLDLQKAFDTVDHSILIMKLEAMGFGNDIVDFFHHILVTENSSSISTKFNLLLLVLHVVFHRVPYLGPFFFLIYVNDIPAVVKNKLPLYADDSAILVSEKDRSSVEKSLSKDLNLVRSWLIYSKLSLHLVKTESIIFCSKQKLKSNGKINVVCDGNHI